MVNPISNAKKPLLCSAALLVLISGCGSSSSDPEQIARDVIADCQQNKKDDCPASIHLKQDGDSESRFSGKCRFADGRTGSVVVTVSSDAVNHEVTPDVSPNYSKYLTEIDRIRNGFLQEMQLGEYVYVKADDLGYYSATNVLDADVRQDQTLSQSEKQQIESTIVQKLRSFVPSSVANQKHQYIKDAYNAFGCNVVQDSNWRKAAGAAFGLSYLTEVAGAC